VKGAGPLETAAGRPTVNSTADRTTPTDRNQPLLNSQRHSLPATRTAPNLLRFRRPA
jgi:hypothetical protein